jgi:hypothetical protein
LLNGHLEEFDTQMKKVKDEENLLIDDKKKQEEKYH